MSREWGISLILHIRQIPAAHIVIVSGTMQR